VYLLARLIGGTRLGFFAAGFTAVSGWTLALAKAGHVYSVLALFSALFLAALIYAERSQQRGPYLWTGILLGVGWLFSSLFIYLVPLVPLAGVLVWLDQRSIWRRIVHNHAATLLIFLVMWIPAQRINNTPPSTAFESWLDPNITFLDSLSRSLLMFNLAGDTSPFHGIVNRPVFAPILSASFVVGVLVWIWRVRRSRRWWDSFLLISLIVTLLPSALSYSPDLQRAALALPISFTIAASGIAFLAQLLTQRWGRIGLGVAAALLVVAGVVIAADAREHYINNFLPAYERAAQLYPQMPPARP
jgi:4-amino-4-deoxy-L-arabinose transferase-like glycosyltransferase